MLFSNEDNNISHIVFKDNSEYSCYSPVIGYVRANCTKIPRIILLYKRQYEYSY